MRTDLSRGIRSRRFKSQGNNSDTCTMHTKNLTTLTHRYIIVRARTKQHLSYKNAARRRRRFRARGRIVRRTHRTRDRRARRRRVGCRDDEGVGAAHQRTSARSARALSTPVPFESRARDNPRLAAARRHTAARFGVRFPRETAFIPCIYFLAFFWEIKWCVHASLLALSNSPLAPIRQEHRPEPGVFFADSPRSPVTKTFLGFSF